MMEQIGTYKSLVCGDECGVTNVPLMYADVPIYGIRVIGLPMVKRDVHQVLIDWFDHDVWINVPRHDVTLTKEGIEHQWPLISNI